MVYSQPECQTNPDVFTSGFFYFVISKMFLIFVKINDMNLPQYTIKIQHETFGILLNETFVNPTQFKLFLKTVQGCIVMKEDLTFFNGTDFFIHIPHKQLVSSIITTSVDNYTLTEHLVNKSKLEALETR